MKTPARIIIVAFLPFLSITKVLAQETRLAEISFSMEEFLIETSGEGEIVVTALDPAYFYPEGPEKPAFPLRAIRFLVPNGAVLEDYRVMTEEEVVAENVTPASAPIPVPTGHTEFGTGNSGSFSGSFPESAIIDLTTMVHRGYTWFSFLVSPFRYDGDRLELSLVRRLQLEVSYRLEEGRGSVVYPDKQSAAMLRNNVLNPEDFEKFYPPEAPALQKAREERIDYLVITSEELAPEFMPLVRWKTRKGLRTAIKTMEEIDGEYPDGSIQLKIKKCLYDYYLHHGLKWALLGGDHEVVPAQGCYGKITIGRDELVDPSIPTDLFYACFDQRFDWNSSMDEKIGEFYKDGHDLIPEIYLSRIPVRTPEHVRSIVDKTLDYEIRQPGEGFADRMLLAGVKSWTLWNGKSDSHHHSESMYDRHIARFWGGSKDNFFDTGTDFTGDHDYHVSSENLTEQLNKGYGIFHFAGHGNLWSLMMETGSGFSTDDALGLRSPFSGLVLSNSCDVNAFDSIDPCLSEAFLRNPGGGCVAFFGSSRYGFGNPNPSSDPGPSLKFNASFMKYLLGESPEVMWRNFGTVAALAKSDFAHNGSSGGVYLYLLYAINPMGDPELPLFTGKPSRFDRVRIYRFSNTITVNTGGIRDCRICVTGLDLEEGYQQVAEGKSYHTFVDVPDAFHVTITAPNHIPYRYISGNATTMQDNILPFVRIYPNPVRDLLRIDLDLPAADLELHDLKGRLLVSQEWTGPSHSLDMSVYPDGVYLLEITAGHLSGWQKVIKSSR